MRLAAPSPGISSAARPQPVARTGSRMKSNTTSRMGRQGSAPPAGAPEPRERAAYTRDSQRPNLEGALMLTMFPLSASRRQTIAVVDIQGAIGPSVRPLEYSRPPTRLRDDRSVRAVVSNIDSPGGSATGSDLHGSRRPALAGGEAGGGICRRPRRLGGDMPRLRRAFIIALPAALVGAIGVISYRPLVFDALDKIWRTDARLQSGR